MCIHACAHLAHRHSTRIDRQRDTRTHLWPLLKCKRSSIAKEKKVRLLSLILLTVYHVCHPWLCVVEAFVVVIVVVVL